MSFRARLTSFSILIVVAPMIAMGLLFFRLISDSDQGKADAHANGLATAAPSVYDTPRRGRVPKRYRVRENRTHGLKGE